MKYIKGLDTLRAFAVIFVILEHWKLPFNFNPSINYFFSSITPNGTFGVNLFFVLSGFLITSILLNAREINGNHKLGIIKNFIIRRALRIFPIYYLIIAFLFIIKYPLLKETIFWHLTYTSNILFYKSQAWNNFSHTWSLSVEEQFYIIWPWLIILLNKRYLKFVFIFSILIGLFTTIITTSVLHNKLGFILMPSCMHAFGIGGLYAYLKSEGAIYIMFLKLLNIAFPLALGFHFYLSFSNDTGNINVFSCFIDSIISIMLIHQTINIKEGWFKNRVIENKVLMKIGELSYGIYLMHYVMKGIYTKAMTVYLSPDTNLSHIALNPYFAYCINLLFLFLFSYASFYLFEKPIMRLKSRFTYN
jgi:peptidoglycan/LPS O-acetylase OafA/YrhL